MTISNVVDLLPEAIVVIDASGTVVWANGTAERLMGRPLSDWMGTNGLSLVHPDDVHLAALSLGTVQDKVVGSPIEVRVATVTGWLLAEVIGTSIGGGRVALSIRDITQRRRWEVAGDDVARFRSLLHNAASLTMLVAGDGTITSASAAITRLLGHDPELVCGQPLSRLVQHHDRAVLAAAMEAAVATGGQPSEPVTVEVSLLRRDGGQVPYELTIVALLDDPTVEGLVVSGHNITRLRSALDALAELAHYDSLTGLPNRRAFQVELDREWTLTQRDGIDSCVVVADLDGFKQLNDRHGHAAGDEALRQFAHALRLAARHTDVLARLGGDEFAVILVRCGDKPAAERFEARLRARMRERRLPYSSEIGVTVGSASLRRSRSAADALHIADVAMLATKRPGR